MTSGSRLAAPWLPPPNPPPIIYEVDDDVSQCESMWIADTLYASQKDVGVCMQLHLHHCVVIGRFDVMIYLHNLTFPRLRALRISHLCTMDDFIARHAMQLRELIYSQPFGKSLFLDNAKILLAKSPRIQSYRNLGKGLVSSYDLNLRTRCRQNRRAYNATRRVAAVVILIHKYGRSRPCALCVDIARMIAKMVWMLRIETESWQKK